MLHLKIIVIVVVTDLKCRLKYLQAYMKTSIEVAKEKYHKTENKVINKQKSSKVYWSLLKIFLKVSDKKIPIIRLYICFTKIVS